MSSYKKRLALLENVNLNLKNEKEIIVSNLLTRGVDAAGKKQRYKHDKWEIHVDA